MSGYDAPAGWPDGFAPPTLPDNAQGSPTPGRSHAGPGAMNQEGGVASGLVGKPRLQGIYDRIMSRRASAAAGQGDGQQPPRMQPLPAVTQVSHLGHEQHTGAPLSGGGIGLPANLLAPAPPRKS